MAMTTETTENTSKETDTLQSLLKNCDNNIIYKFADSTDGFISWQKKYVRRWHEMQVNQPAQCNTESLNSQLYETLLGTIQE